MTPRWQVCVHLLACARLRARARAFRHGAHTHTHTHVCVIRMKIIPSELMSVACVFLQLWLWSVVRARLLADLDSSLSAERTGRRSARRARLHQIPRCHRNTIRQMCVSRTNKRNGSSPNGDGRLELMIAACQRLNRCLLAKRGQIGQLGGRFKAYCSKECGIPLK